MKKKVLLTNFNMVNYSGSELDTLTIANYFLYKNYDVTIFTIEAGYPLINEIDRKIKIVECIESDQLEKHYDLIWSHHYPLLDFLLFTKKIEADHVAYISLSSYEPYETIPPYYKYLDYVSILSKEGLDVIEKDGYDISNINILGNYSFKKYFDGKRKNLNKKIKKICVVSNHVPEEIIECRKLFKKDKIQFDIYGKDYKYVKVDDKLLKEYDVVISIGKTIYYGLSLGIPVYIYDHFGGDGYITKDNIEKSHYYNFSGRFSRRKLTGSELYNDIVNNYETAVNSADYNFDYAYKTFCFEEQMNLIVNNINSKKKFDVKYIYNNFESYIKTAGLFMREMIKKNLSIEVDDKFKLKRCRIYYDFGDGFSDENVEVFYYNCIDNNYKIDFSIKKGCRLIKIYFFEQSFIKFNILKINNKKIDLSNINNVICLDGDYLTVEGEIYLLFSVSKEKKVNLEFNIGPLISDKELISKYQNKIFEYEKIMKKNEDLMYKLQLIQNSRWYKIIQKIRKLLGKEKI